jgi:hypothetical protein
VTGLQRAIERERWDLVWLYLMLGVAEAASKLPRDSLAELISLLAADSERDDGDNRNDG